MEVEQVAATPQTLSPWLWRRQDLWGAVNLTRILKGNNRGISSKLTLSGPSNSLGVTDVHDQVKQGRTSKGGQRRGRETHHMLPHSLCSCAALCRASVVLSLRARLYA